MKLSFAPSSQWQNWRKTLDMEEKNLENQFINSHEDSLQNQQEIRARGISQQAFLSQLGSAVQVAGKVIAEDEGGISFSRRRRRWSLSLPDDSDDSDDSDDGDSSNDDDEEEGNQNQIANSDWSARNNNNNNNDNRRYSDNQLKPTGFLSEDVSGEAIPIHQKTKKLKYPHRKDRRSSTKINSGNQLDDSSRQSNAEQDQSSDSQIQIAGLLSAKTDNNNNNNYLGNTNMSSRPTPLTKVSRLFKKKSFSIVDITSTRLIKDNVIEDLPSADKSLEKAIGQSAILNDQSNSNNNVINDESSMEIHIPIRKQTSCVNAHSSTLQSPWLESDTKRSQRLRMGDSQYGYGQEFLKRRISNIGNANPMLYHSYQIGQHGIQGINGAGNAAAVATTATTAVAASNSGSGGSPMIKLIEGASGFKKAIEEMQQPTWDLLFAMILCHETKSKGKKDASSDGVQHVHLDRDTEGILKFAKEHKFVFECACGISEQLCYLVETPDAKKEKVVILNRQVFESSSNKVVVVCQSNVRPAKFAIVRETASVIPEYLIAAGLSNEKKQLYETVMAEQKCRGERTVFYSIKDLNDEVYNEFLNTIRMETSTKQLEMLYDSLLSSEDTNSGTSQSLKLLGFLGIKDPCDERMQGLVRDLRTMGQKIWVLTSDVLDRTLESCYNYSILSSNDSVNSDDTPTIDLSIPNSDDIFYKIRNQLTYMRRIWMGEGPLSKFKDQASQLLPSQGAPPASATDKQITAIIASSNNFINNNNNNNNVPGSPVVLANHLNKLPLTHQKSLRPFTEDIPPQPLTQSISHFQLRSNFALQSNNLNSPLADHRKQQQLQSNPATTATATTPVGRFPPSSSSQLKQSMYITSHQSSFHRDRDKTIQQSQHLPSQQSHSQLLQQQHQQPQQQQQHHLPPLTQSSESSTYNPNQLPNSFEPTTPFDSATVAPQQFSKDQVAFSLILSGDSLNILRKDSYLWNHFCLLLFYATTIVGVELTEEQKSYLGQTLCTRFSKQSPHVMHIISSLADIERMNFPSVSVYFPLNEIQNTSSTSQNNNNNNNTPNRSRMNAQYSLADQLVGQHCEIIAKSPAALMDILLRKSRYFAENIEETLYLAIQRSYLLGISTVFWNIFTCACNAPLITPVQTLFFHGVHYACSIIFQIQRKQTKFESDLLRHVHPLHAEKSLLSNACSPQNTPIFNLKCIFGSLIDAIIIFIMYGFFNDQDIYLEAFHIRWGLHIISFFRVFDFHHMSLNKYFAMYVFSLIVFITIEAYTALGQDYNQMIETITEQSLLLNGFVFIAITIVKCTLEGLFFKSAPVSLIGISKYLSRQSAKKPSSNSIPPSSPTTAASQKLNLQQQQQQSNAQNQNSRAHIGRKSFLKTGKAAFFSVLGWNRPKQNLAQAVSIIRGLFGEQEMDIVLSSMLMQQQQENGEINVSTAEMVKFFLKFQVREIEDAFVKVWEASIIQSDRVFNILHFVLLDIAYEILMLSKVTNEFSSSDGSYLISYSITASAIFIFTAFSLSKHYVNPNILKIAFMIVIVRSLKLVLLNSFKQIISYPIEFIMHIAIASSYLRISHYFVLLQAIAFFVLFIILSETSLKEWNLTNFLQAIDYISQDNLGHNRSKDVIRLSFYLSYWIIVMSLVTQKYYMSLTLRTNYMSEHNLYKATIKVKDILSILLPKFIREKLETMKQGSYKVAERQDEVVIVFCDISNFDEIIFKEKTNSVRILDKLYRQFDLSCQQNGLQKIETVGKTYLAAGGITDVERMLRAEGRFQNVPPSKRALLFALDLMKIAKSNKFYLSSNKRIIIKVGVHLGPAISGVIGYHKPQFSLIGDTVNTTSRVCSTGLPDFITISSAVYAQVKVTAPDYIQFDQRDVEAKGKGTMVTYQVNMKQNRTTQKLSHSTRKKSTLNFTKQLEKKKQRILSPQIDQVEQQDQFKKSMLEFKQFLANNTKLSRIAAANTSIPSGSFSSIASIDHSSFKPQNQIGSNSIPNNDNITLNTISNHPSTLIENSPKLSIFPKRPSRNITSYLQAIPEKPISEQPSYMNLPSLTAIEPAHFHGNSDGSAKKIAHFDGAIVATTIGTPPTSNEPNSTQQHQQNNNNLSIPEKPDRRITRKSFDVTSNYSRQIANQAAINNNNAQQQQQPTVPAPLPANPITRIQKQSKLFKQQSMLPLDSPTSLTPSSLIAGFDPSANHAANAIASQAGSTATAAANNANGGHRRISRPPRKLNSMTIVGLKPRFASTSQAKEIGSPGLIRDFLEEQGSNEENNNFGSNQQNQLNQQASASPLSPPESNGFLQQLETHYLAKIDIEPDTIPLKEAQIPLEKFVLAYSDGRNGNSNNNSSSGGGSSDANGILGRQNSSISLRMGLCSTNATKSTSESAKLHIEFIKQTTKQQRSIMKIKIICMLLYYLFKLILICLFVYESVDAYSQSIVKLISYSSGLVFFLAPFSFKLDSIQSKLSWNAQRILTAFQFLILQFLIIAQTIKFDDMMAEIIAVNKAYGDSISEPEIKIASVVKVVLPNTITVAMELEFMFMIFSSFKNINFLEKIVAFACTFFYFSLYCMYIDSFPLDVVFFLGLVSVLHLRLQLGSIRNEVRSFNNMRTLEAKKDELDNLIENLLPSHILDQYINSSSKEVPLICEEHDDVTLLFADIAGFTKYSSTTDPIVVVNMLRKLFTDFDDHCLRQDVYKLYTIGDCYVCFGLIDVTKRNPAQEAHNVVRFAFDMIRIIEEVRLFSNCELEMRIGIHTGKIYGGIVGTEIVRYDVYGLDVIIANKMESNGMNGRVTVSETTKNLLEDNYPQQFNFDFKEAVHIKQAETDINAYLIDFNLTESVYDA